MNGDERKGKITIEKGRHLTSKELPCSEATTVSRFRGILLIANGERDVFRLSFLVKSLRKVNYEGPIITIADSSRTSFESRWYKTQLARFSPFEETLFLDADIIAMQSFNELWDFLKESDLWMARDMHSIIDHAIDDKSSRASEQERLETRFCCEGSQPFFNSGVILFRKTDHVLDLFERWHREWERFRTIDQFAIARSMKSTGFFPAELPKRYNYSLRRYDHTPSNDVTFLHCWGYPRNRYASLVSPFVESLNNLPAQPGY
jgi:hypothetical protein